jgi:hypothetical protein
VQDGPYWDALAGFAADATFYKAPDTSNLVCGPIMATVANEKAFDQAISKIETDDEPALWYFTLAPTPAKASPDDKAATVANLAVVAVPVLGVHPPQENAKPTHIEVMLTNGKSGWIPAASARPMISNRLCYAKTPQGEWKIAAFDQNED